MGSLPAEGGYIHRLAVVNTKQTTAATKNKPIARQARLTIGPFSVTVANRRTGSRTSWQILTLYGASRSGQYDALAFTWRRLRNLDLPVWLKF